jgi:hypothetical protein
MGCWHGCGPVHCGPAPRGWYGPIDEYEAYEDLAWAQRRRARERPDDRDVRTSSLEARLDDLHEELRRVEVMLEKLAGPSTGGGPG